jgi:ribosome-associated protein
VTRVDTDRPEPAGLRVTARIVIPHGELVVRASRAGGPGGQHVNTSSTRIEVVWTPATSRALDDEQRARVIARLATRLDGAGAIRVVSAETRSQAQNRERAEERLAGIVRAALVVPKVRRPTKPSNASKERRIATKKLRGETKRGRRQRGDD